jgi:type IV pilus assembly protein PilM
MSTSLWKKEISLRRKVTEAAFPEPLLETTVAAIEVAGPRPVPSTNGDQALPAPLLDRNDAPDKIPDVVVPAVVAPALVAPDVVAPALPEPVEAEMEFAPVVVAKTPLLKRQLSLKRGPKAPKKAKPTKPVDDTPKVATLPIWKRPLKLSKPTRAHTVKHETMDQPHATQPSTKEPRRKQARTAGRSKSEVVGLKIGSSQVTAARVSNDGSPELLQVAREPLPEGIVVGGEVHDIEGLARTLKSLFGKNKLPKRGVRLGLSNNRIGVRTFEIVGIDDPNQLENAIRFRAQETLPIPLDEAVLDWQILSETLDEATGQVTHRVLLVVAYRDLVDRYVAACKKAGIRLAGIDLEAFAMLRALAAPPEPVDGAAPAAQVVVNVGHDRSTFAVSDGRVCEFTRVLGWGGKNLSGAIAKAVDQTPDEVTLIKHVLSLGAQLALHEGIATETLDSAREAVRRELESFARELVSSLRFYQNQPGSLGIGELVLTGGTAQMPGLADELHRLIGVTVRVGDPLSRVATSTKFRAPDGYGLGSLTVAIGLGIDD